MGGQARDKENFHQLGPRGDSGWGNENIYSRKEHPIIIYGNQKTLSLHKDVHSYCLGQRHRSRIFGETLFLLCLLYCVKQKKGLYTNQGNGLPSFWKDWLLAPMAPAESSSTRRLFKPFKPLEYRDSTIY